MDKEKCDECEKALVLGENKQCVYCELNQLKMNSTSLNNINCGICNIFTIRDKESLNCELCKRWYHNGCNEFALDERYCSLVYEAPKNIKWFCDKCIWETEKWINEYTFNKDYRTDDKGSVADNYGKTREDHVGEEKDKSSNKKNKRKIIHKNKTVLKRKKARQKDSCKKINISNVSPQIRAIDKVRRCTRNNSKKDTKPNVQEIEDTFLNYCDDKELNESGEGNKEIFESRECNKKKSESRESFVDSGQGQNDINNESVIKEETITYDQDFQPGESETDSDYLGQDDNSGENGLIDNKKKNAKRKRNRKRFQCNICQKRILDEQHFEAHKLRHTGDKKPYKCPVCEKGFGTKKTLKNHMTIHSNEKPYNCDICGMAFKRVGSCKKHISVVHSEEKTLSCSECDFRCRLKRNLKKHMKNVHKDSNRIMLQCSECDYKTLRQCFLKRHMVIHSNEKPYICDICGKGFKSVKLRKSHISNVHTEEKPISCPECDFRCRLKRDLLNHMSIHEDPNMNKLQCSECDFKTVLKSRLKIHMINHSDERPFVCDECGSQFKTLGTLKLHKLSHLSEKSFKCKICDKGFKTPTNLRQHMFVHSKVKNFFCSVCGVGFILRCKLKSHVKIVHSDEKPFECENCGNKYKTKHNLNHHQKGIRGTCHATNAYKQKIQSLEQTKSSYENNVIESNSSDSGPYLQHNQHIPPLLVYAGGNSESINPVYSSSRITATIHCPPPALSLITGQYVG